MFPVGDGGVWAYEVRFRVPEDAADVRVHLRADDLSLLLSSNLASAATGRAGVYPVDPLTTPALAAVELEGLEEPGRLLRGASLDAAPAAGARMVRPDRDFTADPARPEFDEPQVYHHVWGALGYFRALTDPPLLAAAPFAPMRVLVRDPGSPDNAYYSPDSGELHFGLFGDRSSARCASVVIHELGHAVTDAICRLGRSLARDSRRAGSARASATTSRPPGSTIRRSAPISRTIPTAPATRPTPTCGPARLRGGGAPTRARCGRACCGACGAAPGRRTPTSSRSSRWTSSAPRARSRRRARRCTRSTTGSSAASTAWRSTRSSTRALRCRSVARMRIELHQRGGVLGLDRRVLVDGATIEVIERGRSRGAPRLEPGEAERIGALADSAAAAEPARAPAPPVSDELTTELAIGDRRLSVRSGDGSPAAVWALIGELGRLSGR